MSERHVTLSDGYTGALRGRCTGERLGSGDARITKISVGDMDNNAYLIESLPDGHSVLVDAADDAPALVEWLREEGTTPEAVVTTHWHPDHWKGLEEVRSELGPVTYASAGDSGDIGVATDRTLADGDTLRVGALELEVIGLRGHTDDGLALLLRTSGGTHLFSGDSLFPGGPGKTTSPEDFTRLMDDLEARVVGRLDDDVVVHPGHGDDTTLGAERPHLGEWRARGW